MPRKPKERGRGDEAPRTDLPPVKEPYYDGYFGTDEEEGVVREEEAGDDADDGKPERRKAEDAAEDAAGGDRELFSPPADGI
jgi:hypothetical protein